MRILHTADWHMNHRLGRLSLKDTIEQAIRQIPVYLEKHRIDVLIIAGDIFRGGETREELMQSFAFLKEQLRPFLTSGGTVVAISGNHDSDLGMQTIRDVSDMVAPIREDADGCHAGSRIYFAPNPRRLTLRGRDRTSQPVNFVLMPYPTPRGFLSEADTRYRSIAERNAAMAATFKSTLHEFGEEVKGSPNPTVLVSHVQVAGVKENELFPGRSGDEVLIEPMELPSHWAYGAFGHIHRAQPVAPGLSHFRYCGSLVPLDAGEAGHDKSVYIVEIGANGRLVSDPIALPIAGPRLLDLSAPEDAITPEALTSLTTKYPDHETALFKYRLRYNAAEFPDPFPLHQTIRELFPRWYDFIPDPFWPDASKVAGSGPTVAAPLLEDLPASIRHYLNSVTAWGQDESKEEAIALAEALFADADIMARIEPRA